MAPKLEALHSIIYSGHLFESRHTACGERFFADAPGVYMHKDALRGKAESYCRFVQLDPRAGLFYAVMWELLAHRDPQGRSHAHILISGCRGQKACGWQPYGFAFGQWTRWRLARRFAWLWDPEMEANPMQRVLVHACLHTPICASLACRSPCVCLLLLLLPCLPLPPLSLPLFSPFLLPPPASLSVSFVVCCLPCPCSSCPPCWSASRLD